mmetsp:Transcript_107050/g.299654  ORF Transcript_107050/g.299654 Transcript_107050/m.299654 type:complete len:331 (+) Transcript_107050:79-1071(+)
MSSDSTPMFATRELETAAAVASWATCSIGMMVFNKLAISVFPAECMLTAVQMAVTALLLVLFARSSIHIGSWEDVRRWCMVVPFFVGMLLSSLLALKHAPMSLVIAFRGTSPILALCVERLYPNPLAVSGPMLLSMLTMCFGVALYCRDMQWAENWGGVVWVMLNSLFAVGDRLIQRYLLAKDQRPVDVSTTGVALLNNALSILPIAVAVFASGEFRELGPLCQKLSGRDVLWIVASCVVGCGISFTGIWVQRLIAATSFLVMINVSKFAIIFLEVYVIKNKNPLTVVQIVGVMVTILAGVWYGRARRDIEEQAAKGEQLPLVKNETSKC